MDRLTYSALVKTYSHNAPVADSAPSATALLAGVKTSNSVIGIGPEARPGDCASGRGFEVSWIMALDLGRDRRVLGLFEPDHMQYEADRKNDRGREPSLDRSTSSGCKNSA